MRLAQIGPGSIVVNVIEGPAELDEPASIAWCAEALGGWWVATWDGHPTERGAGPGWVYVPEDPRRFLRPSEVT